MIKLLILVAIILACVAVVAWVRRPREPKVNSEYLNDLLLQQQRLMEIQNTSTDIYAQGQATAALADTRKALDRVLSGR